MVAFASLRCSGHGPILPSATPLLLDAPVFCSLAYHSFSDQRRCSHPLAGKRVQSLVDAVTKRSKFRCLPSLQANLFPAHS